MHRIKSQQHLKKHPRVHRAIDSQKHVIIGLASDADAQPNHKPLWEFVRPDVNRIEKHKERTGDHF